MKTRVGIILLFALAVAGCQKGERAATPLTGVSGSSIISGTVRMADGSSPRGLEVSIPGIGMSTVLERDGQFAFGSVPEESELRFRRAADGVDAILKVDANAGHLQLEVSKDAAKRGGRRRGVGRGGKVREFEGLIVSADSAKVVLFTSKKDEVTISIVAQTVIRRGGVLLTAPDLMPEMRVHVKARNVEEIWTAVQIIVQGDEDGDDDGDSEDPVVRREYEGIVLSTTDSQIVLLDSHRNEVRFNVTLETVIRKGSRTVALEEIQAGWRLHVRSAAAADGSLNAVLVIVQNTRGGGDDDGEGAKVKINGRIASLSGVELVVSTDGGDVTVRTDAATRIRKGRASAGFADLAVGDRVKVEGVRVSDGVVLAKEIEVRQ